MSMGISSPAQKATPQANRTKAQDDASRPSVHAREFTATKLASDPDLTEMLNRPGRMVSI